MSQGSFAIGTGARLFGVFFGLASAVLLLGWTLVLAIATRDAPSRHPTIPTSQSVAARFDDWHPPSPIAGTQWQKQDRKIGTDEIRNCDSPIAWTWLNDVALTLSLVRVECANPFAAYNVENNYRGELQDIGSGSSQPSYARVFETDESVNVAWRQGSTFFAVMVECSDLQPDRCRDNALDIARAANEIEPDTQSETIATNQLFVYLLAPLIFWAILVAPVRIVQKVRSQAFSSKDAPPRYNDVTNAKRKASLRRGARLLLWWLAAILGFLALLFAANFALLGAQDDALVALVSAVAAVFALILGQRVERSRSQSIQVAHNNVGPKGRFGLILGSWSTTFTAGIVAVYVLLVVVGAVGLSTPLELLFYSDDTYSQWPSVSDIIRWIFVLLAIGFRDELLSAIVFAIVPCLVMAYLLRTIGQRLRVADAHAVRARDKRPPFLYLRSFDEDRLRIPAPSVRRAPLEHLVPWRRRSFERVLVETLAKYGPVVTVADPRSRLSPIGAARTTLPHDCWHSAVEQMTHNALAVVVGGTPSDVNAGLDFELSMLSSLPGPRLLLVKAPYRKSELGRRWRQFLNATIYLPLFAALAEPWVQEGTLFASHDHPSGWTAWGCRERTDRAYKLALNSAMTREIPVWLKAYEEEHRTEPRGDSWNSLT